MRGAVLAAVVGVALLVAGLSLLTRDPAVRVTGVSRPTTSTAVEAGGKSADRPVERVMETPEPEAATVPDATPAGVAPTSPTPPTELHFPAVDVTARVVPVGVLATGALQLPDDPSTVGWWSAGALPGEGRGTVVVAGHIDSADQIGVLSLLPQLAAGDVVTLVSAGGEQHSYAVTSRESSPKTALDPALFVREGNHQLVLITCGGRYDAQAGAYEDNVVVLAEPVPG